MNKKPNLFVKLLINESINLCFPFVNTVNIPICQLNLTNVIDLIVSGPDGQRMENVFIIVALIRRET